MLVFNQMLVLAQIATSEIAIFNLETNKLIQLTFNDFSDEEPEWSPDGLNILFTRRIERKISLWEINFESLEESRVTPQEFRLGRAH